MPVIIILHNDEAAVVSEVKGVAKSVFMLFAKVMRQHMRLANKDLEAQYLGILLVY